MSAKSILKKEGRFVGEFGGFLNCSGECKALGVERGLWNLGIRNALKSVLMSRGYDGVKRDPWFFPSPEEYTRVSTKNVVNSNLLNQRTIVA